MTIRCFLGFHSWDYAFHFVGKVHPVRLKEFRVCKHCNTTDMFCSDKHKFVRTNCLTKITYTKPRTLVYLDKKNTIDEWYLEYKNVEQIEGK
jgi:hypothetical protein